MARVYTDGDIKTITDVAEIRAALAAKLPIWIELEKQCTEADELLLQVFDIHPLTIEDIWGKRFQPKLEDYRKYLYVIVHSIRGGKRGAFDLHELDIVIGKTFVITHDLSGEITKDVVNDLSRDPELLCKGPAWLAHAILDSAVNRYLPIVDQLDDEIDKLETEALLRAGTPKGPAVLKRILKFRRMLQELRRTSIHQREILLRLSRGEFEEIPRETTPFFRDVYDHFVRINDLLEGFRDLVSNALDAYLSVQNNRMGEVMKTLTLWSTVMLPLSFIAGIYGMNFTKIPGLDTVGGLVVALASMAVVAVAILIWYRRRGWLGQPKDEIAAEATRPRSSNRRQAHADTHARVAAGE